MHETGTNTHSTGVTAEIRGRAWKKRGAHGQLIIKCMNLGAATCATRLKQTHRITNPARKITRSQTREKVTGFRWHGTRTPGRRSAQGPVRGFRTA